MKKRFFVIVACLVLGMGMVRGQAFFPTEKAAFFDALSAYLNASSSKQDREEAAVMMKAFKGVWDSYYEDSEQADIMRLCEWLHAKSGAKAYPNIFNFVEILQVVPTAGLSHKDVGNWLSYTDLRSKKPMAGMDKYLASCRALFVEKTLSERGNSKWMLRDALWGFPSKDVFELTVDGTLVLASQKDESVIHDTKGIYHIEENRWEGSGGRADWSRFGLPADQVFVLLPDYYTLDLGRSEYTIDSVAFYNRKYFEQAIPGRFEDKVLVKAPNEKSMFPQVKSYRSDYVIPNLLRDIDFEGGIGMMGNQVDVFGGMRKKAVFKFRFNRKETVRVEAPRFVMSPEELLVSDHIALRLYLSDTVAGAVETDSLYHNNLGFRYDNKSRNMMIYRSEKGYGDAPFHDHYHGMDIFLEAMYWNMDHNVVDFRRMEGVNTTSEGDLVSLNYFRMDDFKKLQGLDGTHPMIRLESFLKGFDNVERQHRFLVNDLASYLRFPVEQVLSLMLRLQADGYVEYDSETKWVTVLPRYYDVLESYRETVDFDVIKLHTATSGRQPNLRLDLTNNEMLVFGLTSQIDGIDGAAISLSDRKRVVIVPDNDRIVLKKNRDFSFSGGILAGMFEFFTKDCLFSYDDFTVEMKQVDSLRLYAKRDNQIIPVNGTLEKLQGRLMIDRGDNKSSRVETPDYPVFHSDARAFKFYRNINGGVFHPGTLDTLLTADDLQGKFYYHLDPFVVDSLNDLTMRKVRFEGELVSGGILPDINEPLVVMDDYSLGFDHRIGQEAADSYPMFGGKGSFHENVHLSEDGFYGDGQLDYQTATYKSERFMFYLDSVTAVTNAFKMAPMEDGTLFPYATAEALKLKWDVGKPEITTETLGEPICMYGNTLFSGTSHLSPEGYSAEGKMAFGLTEFVSDHFAFDARSFVADSADFMLYSADSATVAFSATNYRANVDFDSQKVQYDYLDASSKLDFPMNRFVCSLKEAEWDMAANTLHVYNPEESFGDYAHATTHEELLAVHNDASKFISLVPEQDSLQFYCMSADYDMNSYMIRAGDVKIIRVADAAVFPYLQEVNIDADSKLEPISGELLADTLNGYQLYKDAVVNIHSRNHYEAQGYWDYTDTKGTSTPIWVDTIVPQNGISCGYAYIADSSEFKLSDQFGFQGRLTLKATERLGHYDGRFALLAFEESPAEPVAPQDTTMLADAERPHPEPFDTGMAAAREDTIAALGQWFSSACCIDPQAIRIPVQMQRIREENPKMCNGLYYELVIDGGYFASFLTPRAGTAETEETASAQGVLWYDDENQRFLVTDSTRYDSYLTLDSRGVITGRGSFHLGLGTALARFVMHGEYTQYPNDTLTLCGINVFDATVFDDKAMETMADVYANAEGESIDLTQTGFLHYFRSENTEEQTDQLAKAIELEGYPKTEPSGFYCNTIVIPELKMVWNDQLRAFVSVGKIGLGQFGKHIVNKYVDGYVVFDRRLGNITYFFQNDMFMTYLNYNCGDGQLQVHATYGDINQRLYDTKEKNRTVEGESQRFQYVAVPYESMLDFLNRLKYAGLD